MDDPHEDGEEYDFNTPLAVAAVFCLIVITLVDVFATPKHGAEQTGHVQLVKGDH